MKKILITVLSILSVVCSTVGLTACKSNTDDEDIKGKEDTSITETDTETTPNTGKPAVILSAAQKEDLYEGKYGEEARKYNSTYYGVGRTINAITDEYITVSSGYSKVFDTKKLLALNWKKSYVGKMNATTVSGSTMKEYYSSLNTSFNNSFSVDLGMDVFSAGVNNKFGFSTSSDYKETANEIFYTSSQVYLSNLIEIDEYYNLSQFEKVLSANLLEDAQKVQDGKMKAEAFINNYGTHAVLAGYYGGRVDCNYYLRNIGQQWDASTELKYRNNINVSIGKLLTAQNETNFTIQSDLGLTNEEAQEKFTAQSVGGANFSSLSINDFSDNYSKWADSMNERTECSNIVDLPRRSLAAIWDLLPSKYMQAKQALSAYFNEQAEAVSSEFLNKYARHFSEPPTEEGDYENFAGGKGTAVNPYIISEKEHFENIKNFNDKNTYFKLKNSIDLEIWNSPFEFSGHLDGCGHTIEFYQTVGNAGTSYGGLFTILNNATVENIFMKVQIADRNEDNTIKVGAIAGETNGKTILKRISVAGTIALKDGIGFDYAGGVVGRFTGGKIEQCINEAKIESHAFQARAGGIVGYASPTDIAISIIDCCNKGEIKACTAYIGGGRSAGGIAGQVRGHSAFELAIKTCYNDATVEIIQEKNAALGWWGCGGIYGDIENNVYSNITVHNSYWNSNKCTICGYNGEAHRSNGKADMNGRYDDWDESIWEFSTFAPPELKWIKNKSST